MTLLKNPIKIREKNDYRDTIIFFLRETVLRAPNEIRNNTTKKTKKKTQK